MIRKGFDETGSSPPRLRNIALLLEIMMDISPSNAQVERMVKALNHIKTTERVRTSQVKLNSLYRVATNSATGADFNPQAVINHWIKLSTEADNAGMKITLQDGQQVPSI